MIVNIRFVYGRARVFANPGLLQLVIDGNNIGADGGIALATSIARAALNDEACTLQHLDISSNNIVEKSAAGKSVEAAFYKMLRVHENLVYLNASCNAFVGTAEKSIASALGDRAQNLTSLVIAGNITEGTWVRSHKHTVFKSTFLSWV